MSVNVNYKAETDSLPRWELREPQCRRFESIIASAAKFGSITVDPGQSRNLPGARKGMNSRTFCCRLKDAILGFRKYNYPSSEIPSSFDLRDLVVSELKSGKVQVSTVKFQIEVQKMQERTSSPSASLNLDELKAKVLAHDFAECGMEIPYSTPIERDIILQLNLLKVNNGGIQSELDAVDRPNRSVVQLIG